MDFKDIIKKVSLLMDIPEEEIKEQLAAGAMILSSAGLLFAGKKVAEIIAEKSKELKEKDPKLVDDFKTVLAGMQVLLEKHEYNKRRFSQERPNAEIKVAPPPPKPPGIHKAPPPPKTPDKMKGEQEGD